MIIDSFKSDFSSLNLEKRHDKFTESTVTIYINIPSATCNSTMLKLLCLINESRGFQFVAMALINGCLITGVTRDVVGCYVVARVF